MIDNPEFKPKALAFVVTKLNVEAEQIEAQSRNPNLPVPKMHNGMELARCLRIAAKYLEGGFFSTPPTPAPTQTI